MKDSKAADTGSLFNLQNQAELPMISLKYQLKH